MPKVSQSAAEMPNSFALLLGYLNFSAGAFDVSAWKSINESLCSSLSQLTANGEIVERSDTVDNVADALREALKRLHQNGLRHFVTLAKLRVF